MGSGGVYAVDDGGTAHVTIADARTGRALAILGVRLHVSAHGHRFDLRSRQAAAPDGSRAGAT